MVPLVAVFVGGLAAESGGRVPVLVVCVTDVDELLSGAVEMVPVC